MNYKITTFVTMPELARKTRQFLEYGSVALSGGSTFSQLFSHWIDLKPTIGSTRFFPVDERMVPFEDLQSNWGTAYRDFLCKTRHDADKAHHPVSIEQYAELLATYFPDAPPRFDTIFLGVGDDGHTASLFPGQPYLDDPTSVVLQTRSPKPPYDRITLAPAVLASAVNLVVIVAGDEKKTIVGKILSDDRSIPITGILARHPAPMLFIQQNLMEKTRLEQVHGKT